MFWSLFDNWIGLKSKGGFWTLSLPFFVIFMLLMGFVPCYGQGNSLANPGTKANSFLSEERRKLEIYDFKERDLLKELASLEAEVARKKEEIRAIGQQLKKLNKTISRLNKRYEKLNMKAEEVEARLAERLVIIYKYARRGYLRFLASAKDLDEFRQRVTYLTYLMHSDKKVLEELHRQRIKLRGGLSRLKMELSRAKREVVEKGARLSILKDEMESKVIRLMKIHKEREFYETAVKELEGASQQLQYVVVRAGQRPAVKRPSQGGKFVHQKGRLPLPCYGKVIRGGRFFRSKKNHLYKGIFIRTEKDAEVKAIFHGRVEYSGTLKGYGQVIIISHGEKFFTIHGLLAERKKEEGDLVKTGEVIGIIRRQGTPLSPSLYFEIRRGDKNLDPLKWLNLPKA